MAQNYNPGMRETEARELLFALGQLGLKSKTLPQSQNKPKQAGGMAQRGKALAREAWQLEFTPLCPGWLFNLTQGRVIWEEPQLRK